MPIVFGQDPCGHWVFRQFFFDWASPTWLVKAAEIKRQAIGMHECARTLMNANTAQESTQTHTRTHGLTISWLFAFDIWATGYLCFFVGRSSNILSPFTSPNVVRTNSCLWGQKKCKPFTMWPFWRNTRMPCWHPSYLLVNEVYDQTELSWGQWWALNWFD